MYISFLLAFCNRLPLVSRFGNFHDVSMWLVCKRGRSIWYPTSRRVCLKKSYWRYRLLTSLLLGISSHGYVKDILWLLDHNNFYANIGLALFKNSSSLLSIDFMLISAAESSIWQLAIFQNYRVISALIRKICFSAMYMPF